MLIGAISAFDLEGLTYLNEIDMWVALPLTLNVKILLKYITLF